MPKRMVLAATVTISSGPIASDGVGLIVQDNTQERIVDVNPAVAFDEAHLPEFVHEEIDP